MEIISTLGAIKALSADISVISSRGAVERVRLGAQVTSSTAISRTAGQGDWLYFNTLVMDNCNAFRATPPTARLYAPENGWYLANVYLQSLTATAHEATLQIHSTRLGSHLAYKKWKLPAGSASLYNCISLSTVAYMQKDDYFYSNWGASQAITSLTGVMGLGFGIWRLS